MTCWKLSAFAVFLAAMLACVPAALAQPAGSEPGIEIELDADDSFLVPIGDSEYYDERAVKLATEIEAFDQDLVAWEKERRGLDWKTRAAYLEAADELRDEAARELFVAYQIAFNTSSGQLDAGRLRHSAEALDAGRRILDWDGPFRMIVDTRIRTSVPDGVIHYVPKRDLDQGSGEWSSYSEGDDLRIGTYVFRVSAKGVEVTREKVQILSDPTVRTLHLQAGAP